MLSAHFDSWDGGSGATDNGTGTVTMLEALRILRTVYPNPKRTILVGHWNGEEQGLNGSRAFVADNPQVSSGLQALFNQDNGTGRVVNISTSGFLQAGGFFGRWLAQIPQSLTQHITLQVPGAPGAGGTDHVSFVCVPAPGFNLSALNWEYSRYTWHTNRDTFDKVMIDEVKNNAVLTAMLAYLASEDPEFMPRDLRTLPVNPQTGQPGEWPVCRDGARRN
jgi:carboxypeptidase Q